jgi:hypothetical protein
MKVALVCIAKDEDEYIKEWIDYHKKLGFDKIFVFENNWRCKVKDDMVSTIEFDGEIMQIPAYNAFIERFRYEYDWVSFIDVDEFIVLKKHENIKEFLKEYDSVENGIAINWVLFGNNGHEEPSENYSVLERFTKREIVANLHIKTFLKLKRFGVKMVNPHHPNVMLNDTNLKEVIGPFHPKGSIDVVQINHYFCKTLPEFRKKIGRGRADLKVKRRIEEWEKDNKNEVDDFLALNYSLYGKFGR